MTGPIDEATSPEQLVAHVVTPGPRPRIHGYDAEGDLARHYGLVDTLLLALTGELPEPRLARAAESALCFLAPLSIAEAPGHAAALTQICGGSESAVVSAGVIALVERSREWVDHHRPLLDWLATGDGEIPPEYLSEAPEQREAVERLVAAIGDGADEIPALKLGLTRDAALVAVLFHAGLRGPLQLVTLLTSVRLPCVTAEASRWEPRSFGAYPINLPRFLYREDP